MAGPSASRRASPSLPTILEVMVENDRKAIPMHAVKSSYRSRYTAYLAATFGISLRAATVDVESALAPRMGSNMSEDEANIMRGRALF
ncbi:hypothetical protein ANO11243_025030 [Dothideomycetidae sp. 11243]|nr:hypothetical protein ANO11243_025030 [fungal sp. No.11243]